jgi:hypothetical protein
MIAALFIEEGGCYSGLPGVDAWPESRDARLYAGPWPVVAHPPCQRWGRLGLVNFVRYGGEHNRPGNDGGCFAAALAAVNAWGGVLEHPAGSYAWAAHGLLTPTGHGWNKSGPGWVCKVCQSAYGHRAKKLTWLYYVGPELPPLLNWRKPDGTHQVGWTDTKRAKDRNKPTLSSADAAATPIEFRDALLAMARSVTPAALAA